MIASKCKILVLDLPAQHYCFLKEHISSYFMYVVTKKLPATTIFLLALPLL